MRRPIRRYGITALVALVSCAALLLIAALVAPRAEAEGTAGSNIPALNILSLSVAAASGTTDILDAGDSGSCAFVMQLTALTGGTTPGVTFTSQTSQDSTNWFDVQGQAACTAACTKSDFTLRTYMRYERFRWATTGTPDTATAHFFINCFR